MIYIPIIIIIIILVIDLYFTYIQRLKKRSLLTFLTCGIINEDTLDNTIDKTDENIIRFKKPNPWNKIDIRSSNKKYYIKINNINKYIDKIVIWKQLPFIKTDMIDMDIEKNYMIIKTPSEEEALVITNLIISYINGDITIEEILSRNMIKTSINKAKKIKLVSVKLTELINEGVEKLNSVPHVEEEEMEDKDEKVIDKKIENMTQSTYVNEVIPEVKEDIPLERIIPISRTNIVPYEGSEYASINF
jgi:hypothetical protein